MLVKRSSDRRWEAEEWSAYFARLKLPETCGRFYRKDGCVVAEFSSSDIRSLSHRLKVVGQQLPEKLVFGVPENLRISKKAFERWKEELESV